MVVSCPCCGVRQNTPDGEISPYKTFCPECFRNFAAVGHMTFLYMELIEKNESGEMKIACPYCGLHCLIPYRPKNDLVHCPECSEISILPPERKAKTEAEMIVESQQTAPQFILPPRTPVSTAENILKEDIKYNPLN